MRFILFILNLNYTRERERKKLKEKYERCKIEEKEELKRSFPLNSSLIWRRNKSIIIMKSKKKNIFIEMRFFSMTTYFTYITSINMHKHLNSSWAFISLRSWLVSNAQLLLTNIVFEIFLTQFTSIYIKFKVVHVIINKIFMISSWILQFIIIFRKLRTLLSLLCIFFLLSRHNK